MKFFLLSLLVTICSADMYWGGRDRFCRDIDLAAKVGKCDRDQVAAMSRLAPGACKDNGFTVANGTFDYDAGICGVLTFHVWHKAKVNGEWYRKAGDRGCGDIELEDPVGQCPRDKLVEKAGLEAGTCKDAGYAVPHGTKVYDAGICGNLTFNVYTKDLTAVVNGEWYRKAGDRGCGDIELDEKVGQCTREQVVEKGKMEAGTCKDAGYAVPHGTHVVDAGICGNLTINIYTKEYDFLLEPTPVKETLLFGEALLFDPTKDDLIEKLW